MRTARDVHKKISEKAPPLQKIEKYKIKMTQINFIPYF